MTPAQRDRLYELDRIARRIVTAHACDGLVLAAQIISRDIGPDLQELAATTLMVANLFSTYHTQLGGTPQDMAEFVLAVETSRRNERQGNSMTPAESEQFYRLERCARQIVTAVVCDDKPLAAQIISRDIPADPEDLALTALIVADLFHAYHRVWGGTPQHLAAFMARMETLVQDHRETT